MGEWRRIPEDEPLPLERRELRFGFAGGEYSIICEPSTQHYVTVVYDGVQETWPIEVTEVNDGQVRLSGLADWVPEILGDVCWFELLIADDPLITYWGDRVIYRQDFSAA